jgi:hypothetical protein
VAAALDDGNEALTLKQLHEHTLTLAQCERMAIEATEGEQKLAIWGAAANTYGICYK